MVTIKQKINVLLTTERNIMAHQGLANIKLIKYLISESHITEFFKRLNGVSTDSTITKIRLKQVQLNLNLTHSLMVVNMTTLNTIPCSTNLMIDALKLSISLDIRQHNMLLT